MHQRYSKLDDVSTILAGMTTQTLTDRQQTAWSSYQRMRARLAGRLGRELARATGLSEADFEILSHLTETPDAPVRALALRCGLEWEKSRLSHQLRRMEQRGLVTREPCVEDNRGFVVRVSAEGRRLAEAGRRVHDDAVRRYVCEALTSEQLDALGEIADAILAGLEEPDTS
jgi:DNA-binding MarR family transcriptional regulator